MKGREAKRGCRLPVSNPALFVAPKGRARPDFLLWPCTRVALAAFMSCMHWVARMLAVLFMRA